MVPHGTTQLPPPDSQFLPRKRVQVQVPFLYRAMGHFLLCRVQVIVRLASICCQRVNKILRNRRKLRRPRFENMRSFTWNQRAPSPALAGNARAPPVRGKGRCPALLRARRERPRRGVTSHHGETCDFQEVMMKWNYSFCPSSEVMTPFQEIPF